ncbi:hypothetical protein QBC35DRAFT_131716 [Podospora australis]|uniref:LTD domain-containing protein n=1 Tax=Podospora australis TaxID=1536484 RepID=A0AAN6WJG6_9PEZI|nr:hypothetical protein QBC35DRAFT_131716 [Podospora australis]
MPLQAYGLWKATPLKWKGRASPGHGHITFADNHSHTLDAAVNIQSKSADSRLVYWLLRSATFVPANADRLLSLPLGFHPQSGPSSLALDFVRQGFLSLESGILLSHSKSPGGQPGDILSYLDPIMQNAIAKKAAIFIFGEPYEGKDGIHDVHMNQGNGGGWANDNGTYQDGGILLHFPDDGHWEGVFLAFAIQVYKTDDRGYPVGDDTFAELLTKGGGGGGTGPKPGEPEEKGQVVIEAALVNPYGPDDKPTRGEGETVYLLNKGTEEVVLEGWRLENGQSGKEVLGKGIVIAGLSKKATKVPGMALSNKGGSIILKDGSGKVVHQVKYTKEQAGREGVLVYFGQK